MFDQDMNHLEEKYGWLMAEQVLMLGFTQYPVQLS